MAAALRFCLNDTSTDGAPGVGELIPGSQLDRYFAPVWAALDEMGVPYSVGRQPMQGAMNVYPNSRGTYLRGSYRLDAASVGVSHGIADKTYLDNYNLFKHTFAPGPAHVEALTGRFAVSGRRFRSTLHKVGYPKLDPLLNRQVGGGDAWAMDGRVRVLYAPTHGGGSERFRNGNKSKPGARATSWWIRDEIQAALPQDIFEVLLAPHPRHAPGHRATFAEYVEADVVIADGGSTIYEAWVLGKPVVLPAWETRGRNLGRGRKWGGTLEQQVYESRTGRHAERLEDLPGLVEDAAAQGQTGPESEFSLRVLPCELRGVSGQAWAERLVQIQQETRPARSAQGNRHLVRERRQRRQARAREFQAQQLP